MNDCKNTLKCSNCGGEHYSTSRSCLVWKREKEIVTIKCKEGLSFPEAKKIVETRFNLTVSYANVTKNNSSKPVERKDAITQTDVAVQTEPIKVIEANTVVEPLKVTEQIKVITENKKSCPKT